MIYFLSGLPRSGSTLLGSILNQNADVYVSPTSPLLDLLCLQNEAMDRVKTQYTFDYETQTAAVYDSLPLSFYKHIKQPYIIDKHRAWPKNMHPAQLHVSTDPKVICTYRPIPEVITSFIKLIDKDPNNFVDAALRKKRSPINTKTRAMELWTGYISDPWNSLQIGIQQNRHRLHFISYDELIHTPQDTINGIYDFLEIPRFVHTFTDIHNTCSESKDSAWGLKDLHTVRKQLEKTSNSAEDVLGSDLCKYYSQYNLRL